MGIFNDQHNINKMQVNNISESEHINLNLLITKNNPIPNLIVQHIYPKISDFTGNINITSNTYNKTSYINTLVNHIEIKPDKDSTALLLWTSLDYALIIRDYTFTVIIYVRKNSKAIGYNLEIMASLPNQVYSKVIILFSGVNTASLSFQNALAGLTIFLRGSKGTIPIDGYIELLYYGIYYS